ncbi:MAG: GNAT family N-acetyltransferase [Bacilli bacterium]
MVVLRDMKEADIDGYVKWFTFETEWAGKWDAPWENKLNFNVGDERKSWEERFDSTKGLEEADRKWKFEIEVEGKRIGWVNSYYDLEDFGNSNHIIAIGIDIPEAEDRNKGYGSKALSLFIDCLHSKGEKAKLHPNMVRESSHDQSHRKTRIQSKL